MFFSNQGEGTFFLVIHMRVVEAILLLNVGEVSNSNQGLDKEFDKQLLPKQPVVVRKKKMGTIKIGDPMFEVMKYDGCTNDLLWDAIET